MRLPRTAGGKYSVEAVARSLDILEAFNGPEDLTLLEICRRVGMSKSRTFRLLYTLTERGYVERNAGGMRYQLGAKLFERAAHVRRDLKDLARPFMRDLHQRFNETVNLGVMNEGDVLYIDILETSRPFRMTATIGCRMPAHSTAMGKAMLALMPDTAAVPKSARRELGQVCRRGYAIDDQDNERGVACIGAAILDASGLPVAAMSVSGPNHRILAGKKKLAPAVMAACNGISCRLGFSRSIRTA